MPFKTPITVKDTVNFISSNGYLLPAIQRELVWNVDQITRLFDSLMLGYPIGSFLFWKVQGRQLRRFRFYEFIRRFHEMENVHNPRANVAGERESTAILDGQQRLTALYIGLKGTYAYRKKWLRRGDPASYPERELYINLLGESQEVDMTYDFKFLTKEESTHRDEKTSWFKVGRILDFPEDDPSQINDYLVENSLVSKHAGRCIFRLHRVIHSDPVINYFEEEGEDLDRVLRIFVRTNSGGTPLSYSDLLLSIATSQWQEKDARQEILSLVDELNGTRGGFTFDKDFVLKSSLVLSDISDIAFRVTNFNVKNMREIEDQWNDISRALRLAVALVSSFGFYWRTLTSNYAVIPIAYYLKQKEADDNFIMSRHFREDRQTIRQWLIISLLKRTFGGQPDTVLRPVRRAIKKNHDKFPFESIRASLSKIRPMTFTEEDLEGLLSYTYGNRYTFAVLSLLYPALDCRDLFHQDHIFPQSFFSSSARLKAKGISQEQHDFYLDSYDYLGNLQLLPGIPNQEKRDKDFNEWLQDTYPDAKAKTEYQAKHYIPDVDLAFSNFPEFIEERQKMLLCEFRRIPII